MEHERRNDKPSLVQQLDPHNLFEKQPKASTHVSDMSKLAPAAETAQQGIPSGIPGKKLAYTAGTCDATPDQ